MNIVLLLFGLGWIGIGIVCDTENLISSIILKVFPVSSGVITVIYALCNMHLFEIL